MSSMSNYLEGKLRDHVLRGTAYTAPTTVHIALFTAAPTDAGGGTEVSGGSYARVAVPCTTANWSAIADNVNALTWATSTANWGTIVAVGIFDAATGGNLLFHGLLTANKTVASGDTFSFPAASLDVVFD